MQNNIFICLELHDGSPSCGRLKKLPKVHVDARHWVTQILLEFYVQT